MKTYPWSRARRGSGLWMRLDIMPTEATVVGSGCLVLVRNPRSNLTCLGMFLLLQGRNSLASRIEGNLDSRHCQAPRGSPKDQVGAPLDSIALARGPSGEGASMARSGRCSAQADVGNRTYRTGYSGYPLAKSPDVHCGRRGVPPCRRFRCRGRRVGALLSRSSVAKRGGARRAPLGKTPARPTSRSSAPRRPISVSPSLRCRCRAPYPRRYAAAAAIHPRIPVATRPATPMPAPFRVPLQQNRRYLTTGSRLASMVLHELRASPDRRRAPETPSRSNIDPWKRTSAPRRGHPPPPLLPSHRGSLSSLGARVHRLSRRGVQEITAFLNHLAIERPLSGSTQNQALCALVFSLPLVPPPPQARDARVVRGRARLARRAWKHVAPCSRSPASGRLPPSRRNGSR